MTGRSLEFTTDPASPWSSPGVGGPALIAVAVLLLALTVWTYRPARVGRFRFAVILSLRLAALLIALLTILRPSVSFREDLRVPSTLVVALDASRSMTVRDETDARTRWDALKRALDRAEPALAALRDGHNVTVKFHRFAEDATDDGPDAPPDGSRTDFGQMLRSLHQRYAQERALRGLIVLSDGADNGARYPALSEAAKWRATGGGVSTFVLGQANTSAQQRDIGIVSATALPSPVPVKGKLTVKAVVDAPGFENAKVRFRLGLDGTELAARDEILRKSTGNEVVVTADAPATPGEYKLTLKAEPLPGEATLGNNEITTYVTVTREGVSVLLVDRLRLELKFLRKALASDPRVRLYEAVRQTDDPTAEDLFRGDAPPYDVIIIGDVTARRLRGRDPKALEKIRELVRDRGVGLLMVGGADSFANSDWRGTPVAEMLPVELDASGQADEPTQLRPAPQAQNEFVMRIAADDAASQVAWQKLPPLPGSTRLGRPKPTAAVVGVSQRGQPLLVRHVYGRGRVVALALDMTYLWQQLGQTAKPRTTEGVDLHAKFWRQMVLYLAQQEETEGSIWLRPDVRRVAAGGKLGFVVGARGKNGRDLTDGDFEVQAFAPGATTGEVVATARDSDGRRGTVWKTDKPGEYRLVVRGSAKDDDGGTVSGEATARFVVYQDDTELLRQAADHDLMQRLAAAGGGEFHRADELGQYLEKLRNQPLPGARQKPRLYPDWRSPKLDGWLPGVFLAFVAVLGLEWGLRRAWGLV